MFDSRAQLAAERATQRTTTSSLGKVIHDDRGNAIWDWAIETGVLAKATAAELARSLAHPVAFALELETGDTLGWSGDPYNRSQR